MNERIHRALDGELAWSELTPAEAAAAARLRDVSADVLGAIPREPLPDLTAAVLARIDGLPPVAVTPADDAAPHAAGRRDEATTATIPARRGGALRWLLTPRAVTLRPAYGLAAAALVAALLVVRPGAEAPAEDPAMALAPTPTLVLVHFQLAAPDAQDVTLAGDFTQWQPAHRLARTTDGLWTVVVPLTPGVHEYAFVVDGTLWVADPAAPAVGDGFGGANSRVAVLGPDARAL